MQEQGAYKKLLETMVYPDSSLYDYSRLYSIGSEAQSGNDLKLNYKRSPLSPASCSRLGCGNCWLIWRWGSITPRICST